jgi:hypothetical protein
MATLDEFESRLQALLEVHLLRHLPGYKVEDGIAQQLAAEMHAHLKEEPGVTYAPNLYTVVAHPDTMHRWKVNPSLVMELADALYGAGKEAGFIFSTRPTLTFAADFHIAVDELDVFASFSSENVAETQGIPHDPITSPTSGKIPSNAFLIIGGSQVFPLNRSVINIGRRLDNHIVIDDPRVSRAHAQLRTVGDRFVIFDLNSSGGCFVNGQRINQADLFPGDVISLAGVSLIFGQDLPAGRNANDSQTEPGLSISNDAPADSPNEEAGLGK